MGLDDTCEWFGWRLTELRQEPTTERCPARSTSPDRLSLRLEGDPFHEAGVHGGPHFPAREGVDCQHRRGMPSFSILVSPQPLSTPGSSFQRYRVFNPLKCSNGTQVSCCILPTSTPGDTPSSCA